MNLFLLRIRKFLYVLFRPILWPAAVSGVFPSLEHKECLMMLSKDVDLVVDIGANKGQFALLVADIFESVNYIAFEPIPEVYALLRDVVSRLPLKPKFFNIALSDVSSSRSTFHLASAADSSSLLPISDTQTTVFHVTDSGQTLLVDVKTLDNYLPIFEYNKILLIKIDVQGLELNVLRGAIRSLSIAKYVLVEASNVEFYEGQSLHYELDQFMLSVGFKLHRSFANTFGPKGKVLQGDYLYIS